MGDSRIVYNTTDMIDHVSKATDHDKKVVKEVLNGVRDVLEGLVEKNRKVKKPVYMKLPFATYKLIYKPAEKNKRVYNPAKQTHEVRDIPEKRRFKIGPASSIKKML